MANKRNQRGSRTGKIVVKADAKPASRLQTAASRPIPLVRVIPDHVPTLFADGLVIQHVGDAFVFSFLKIAYPLLDKIEDYAQVTEVEQRAVAQIAMSFEQMARNINVLNKNFKKFLLKQEPDVRAILNKVAELPLTDKEKTQAAKKE